MAHLPADSQAELIGSCSRSDCKQLQLVLLRLISVIWIFKARRRRAEHAEILLDRGVQFIACRLLCIREAAAASGL